MAASGSKEVQMFAEQYFKTQSFLNKKIIEDISSIRNKFHKPAWDKMSTTEKDKVIDAGIIHPEVQSIYCKSTDSNPTLSSFPKLKIRTGQKFILEETNTSDGKPFSYRDEHSSPFGWKTRSQQNLHFDIYDSKEQLDQESLGGLDCVSARRSAILSCPFGQYSSRTPRTAKPVSIPVVPDASGPNLNSQEDKSSSERETYQDIAEVTSLVSSVVIENDNNIVLDFSSKMEDDDLEDTTSCTATPVTARSDASSNSLLSKVIKKCKTPTLKRKKSMSSTDTLLTNLTDDVNYSDCGQVTNENTPIRSSPQRISKPSCAPPPPPSVSRPTTAPPPPPPTATSRSRPPAPPAPPTRDPLTRISTAVDVNVSLEELTVDMYNDDVDTDPILEKNTNNSTDLKGPEIKKTGFDFLDNW